MKTKTIAILTVVSIVLLGTAVAEILRNLTALTGASMDIVNDRVLINDDSANTDMSATLAELKIGLGNDALTAAYIGYGSASNLLTGEAAFTYTAASDLITVPNVYASTGIELSNATANTLTAAAGILSIEGVAIPTLSNTAALTNKTISLSNNTVTATSAELKTALSDEVGTGAAMFTRTGVRRTVYINAGAMIVKSNGTTPAGVAATPVEHATGTVLQDSIDFDTGATEEQCGFWFTFPSAWDGADTITVKYHWTAAGGTATQTVQWGISGRCYGDNEAMGAVAGTEVLTSDALQTVDYMHISAASTAITMAGTTDPNKPCYFKIRRDTSNDDLSVDAKLLGITLEYTESATEPSAQ